MSGGHYNWGGYLDIDRVFERPDSLEQLIADIVAAGDMEDVARELTEVLLAIKQLSVRGQVIIERLWYVCRAMDYWKSGDYARQDVDREVAKYRARQGCIQMEAALKAT